MSKLPAVLVIDVQQSFLHAPYWCEDDVPAFRQNLSRLLDAATARGWPIVRILHEDDDAHFSVASGLVRPMAWVPEAHDAVFHKRVHNAFTDTGLQAWLRGAASSGSSSAASAPNSAARPRRAWRRISASPSTT